MSRLPRHIAIDGPSGAGKSVLAERLAQRLGYRYIDTGAIYRAVTLAALKRGIDLADQDAITQVAETVDIQIETPTVDDGRQYTVLIDGEDVTWAIRDRTVEQNVSTVSAVSGVRRALVPIQQRIAESGGVVMVGRDITTVVLPHAELKIYLTASAAKRAERRHSQLAERGVQRDIALILAEIEERDRLDSTRADSPLTRATDSILLENNDISVCDLVNIACGIVERIGR